MSLLDKFIKMLIPKDRQKTKESPTEKLDPGIQETQAIGWKQASAPQSDKQERVATLTPREHDLYLLLEGFTLKESAEHLGVKYSTANTHMTGVYRKLGVKSRAELIINYRDISGRNTFFP